MIKGDERECSNTMTYWWEKILRRNKGRIKKGMSDGRRWQLYLAGRDLLVDRDCDQVSVAEIARKAGVSVGAFYERWKTKDDYLWWLGSERIYEARGVAIRELRLPNPLGLPVEQVVRKIVEHTIRTLNGRPGGVVKAAIKCGQLDDRHLLALSDYRNHVADLAVRLLQARVGHGEKGARAIRTAVQMVQATAIDVLHHDAGILRRGRARTVDALTAMMLGYLGLDSRAARDAPDPGDALIDLPAETAEPAMPAEFATILEADEQRKKAKAKARKPSRRRARVPAN